VDDEPAPRHALFEFLAEKCDRPLPPSVPINEAAEFKRGATNKRVLNRRLREDLGYQLKFPSFRDGVGSVLGG